MDSQILRLLFYSALVAVAILLAYFGYFLAVPRPADYWGLDPDLSPAAIAERAFSENDYRFLTIRSELTSSPTEDHITGIIGCSSHPAGSKLPARPNEQIDVDDLATRDWLYDYAWAYNRAMAELLNDNMDAGCRVFYNM